jgi:CRISPR-associated protein Cas5d
MKQRNQVEFQVIGAYALFADPITRVGGEKSSYHVPTYEGIKGILHSVYWKPTFIWIIDEVRVMHPIQTETKGIRPITYTKSGNELSYYTYLKDVCYQVKAHFEWNENRPTLAGDRNEHKHHNIAKRMICRGGRRDIFLGARECQGYVEPCEFGTGKGFYDEVNEVSYGFMYHGITYADEAILAEDKGKMTVRFFYPVMKKGIIEYIHPQLCPQKRYIREMEIKEFGTDNFSGLDEFTEVEVSG